MQYADAIFRHCYFRIDDHDQAKDLMQQTFARAWEYSTQGKKIRNVRAFLYQTARNLIVDFFRQKKETSLDSLLEKGREFSGKTIENPEQHVENKEIRGLLLKLQQNDREIIVMRYIDGLKPKEIAEILEESANVVSVRLHRASQAFKSICKKHGYSYEE
jgi:RNA polymerase sigma-70 factor (ECF subfamily)